MRIGIRISVYAIAINKFVEAVLAKVLKRVVNGHIIGLLVYGGGRGIRTPGTLSGTTVFKTVGINRSPIPPLEGTARLSSQSPGANAMPWSREELIQPAPATLVCLR